VTACVVIAVLLLLYTYAGYPIAIGMLARSAPWRARPPAPAKPEEMPKVTVCLPVYNGTSYLPAKIRSIFAQDYPADRFEILVYCDGGADDERIARDLAASPEAAGRLRVIMAPERKGKPTALNVMGEAATGDLLLLNDVRQPLSPNAMSSLVAAMADDRVGCATGNLVLDGPAGSGVYWRYENWIRLQESRFRGVVGMTGPIAMMRRADLRQLPEDLILDDVWIPMQLGLAGKRVSFVPEAEARDAAFEDDREFRRKARTLAGNYQLFSRMPALFSPFANRIWFETMSHKIMRLVAPWLLLLLVLTTARASMITGSYEMRALLAGQIAFYAAAAVGARGGRLAGVARTFVVLNAAAVVGLYRFLTGRQRVTW
jgi:cellulose synthase/poly-beta-1,6-N-acetylglucosamine synthase-like glycosyltransferase